MSGMLLALFLAAAHGEAVSMLDDAHAIECSPMSKAPFDRIVMERKEQQLNLFKDGKPAGEFQRLKFLDSAFLVKSGDKHVLVQIFANGSIYYTSGELFSFFEKNCDDTGASKTCKTDAIKKFFWSAEKLELTAGKISYTGAVDHYGYLANHATYFRASVKGGRALVLIDYGAPLDLLAGETWRLNCHYLP